MSAPPRGNSVGLGASAREALATVVEASKTPSKRRGTAVKPSVETLASALYERGALPAELSELVDLVTATSYLDQASLASIIRNLFPASTVSSENVLAIIGSLGHGQLKPSLAIQAALLQWLIMVYHLIDRQEVFSRAYSVIFNLLDTAAIRPKLCHLLALITRRRHVRPFRIQSLLELSRQTGSDPALTGLLRIFKDYYPEIIVGDAARGKAASFKHPDTDWREHLDAIQRQHTQRIAVLSNNPQDPFRVSRQNATGNRNGGRLGIPEVHTSHAHEESITLEEIDGVEAFVKSLEKIELPNQMVAVLGDPLLHKLLLLRPDAEIHARISAWVATQAQDLADGADRSEVTGLFETMKDYLHRTKNMPPALVSLMIEYLRSWNGIDNREILLDMLSYIPLQHYQALRREILEPFEAAIVDGSAISQSQILRLYTAILRSWTALLLSSDVKYTDAKGSMVDLNTRANELCLTLLQTAPGVSTSSLVLDFMEQAANLASNASLLQHVHIVTPPLSLVYILHFSPSATILSRISGVLAQYKQGFQAAMAVTATEYALDSINSFNGFLMDICNCIWRSRAFSMEAKDVNAHGCLVARPAVLAMAAYVKSLDRDLSIGSLFSLSFSPTMGSLSMAFFRNLEESELESDDEPLAVRHAGPVTSASLTRLARDGGLSLTWPEYRLGVLRHLEENGMPGVGDLMYNTMTNLMKQR